MLDYNIHNISVFVKFFSILQNQIGIKYALLM
jgi:hypothetical protein